MATDVDGVYLDWGTPAQARIERATPDRAPGDGLAAGSMGPKVDAAVRVRGGDREARGHRVARGHRAMVDGSGGTQVVAKEEV